MEGNPYQVVGSPSYAAPLVNFFGGQRPQQPQPGQPQQGQPGQPNPQQQASMAARLAQLFGIRPGQQQGQPGAYQPPGPMNLQPNAMIPPNANPTGLY